MIIKGTSRCGPAQLAMHLQRTDTNEKMRVMQLDSPTGDLGEAFRDWQLLATGTRGFKGLYHANIDPDAKYSMTDDQWQRAVDVLEKELGLEGQPRAVVMHEKHGRQHIHVVWQRTDLDTMTLRTDSYNYVAHERASLALEKEFGHELVPGKHAKRDRNLQPEMPRAEMNHAEWQQAERAATDPRAFKEAITAAYEQSDNGKAFQAALEEQGLTVAQGDRRDYVIVDDQGQVYSLSRQIKGVTAKDLRAFMSDVDREALPTVEEAKALQQERARQPGPEPEPPQKPDEVARIEIAVKERHERELAELRQRHADEQAETSRRLDEEIAFKRRELDISQQAELAAYDTQHPIRRSGEGLIGKVRDWINPERAEEDYRRQESARDDFLARQEMVRNALHETWDREKAADLDALASQQHQAEREKDGRYEKELAQHIRDHEAAERARAERVAQRQRDQELRLQQERDGRPPPGRAR